MQIRKRRDQAKTGGARGLAVGQVKRAGISAASTTAGGGACGWGNTATLRLELSAGPMPPVEHNGQPNALDSVGSFSSVELFCAGAWVRGSTVQNWPPMPLSCMPSICPCPILHANTLNRTQQYSIQAMSERSARAIFMGRHFTISRRRNAYKKSQADYPHSHI